MPAESSGFAPKLGLFLGPVLALIVALLPPPAGLEPSAMRVAGLFLLMAIWWATEAIPMAVTSLLPLAILPLFGILELKDVAAPYADPVVMLLLGGFIVALAIEKWNLHRRIALNVLRVSGARVKILTAGVMLAPPTISRWYSNTATMLLITPHLLSVAGAGGRGAAPAVGAAAGRLDWSPVRGIWRPVGPATQSRPA